MSADQTTEGQAKVPMRRVALAAGIGTAVEWYDFYLFGTMAAIVFGKLFFPAANPAVGTMAAFGAFGAGFIARPIGAIVCGHFGDRVGRKRMMVILLFVMGVATTAIGLLPTYDTIGVWAPILLVAIRLIQGFSVGGEMAGGQLLCVEYAPGNRRGIYGAIPGASAPIGLILSTSALLVCTLLVPEDHFLDWGWRIPFLLSSVLLVVGMVVRFKVLETPVFQKMLHNDDRAKLPIAEVLRDYRGAVITSVGLYMVITTTFFVVTVWAIAFAVEELGMTKSLVLGLSIITMVFAAMLVILGGYLSDRFGRRAVFLGGAVAVAVLAFPGLALIGSGSPALFLVGSVVVCLGLCPCAGAQGAYFAEMFGPRVRFSGVSLGITVASLIGGAIVPSLATALVVLANGSTWGVALLVMGAALITLLAALYSRSVVVNGNRELETACVSV